MKRLFILLLAFCTFCLTAQASAQNSFFLVALGASSGGVTQSGTVDSLTEGSVSNAATMDINLTSFIANYNVIIIQISVVPVTDGADLWMLVSKDGATYDNSAGNYGYIYNYGAGDNSVQSSPEIVVAGVLGGAAGQHTDGTFIICNPNNSAYNPSIRGDLVEIATASDGVNPITLGAQRNAAQITKAVRYLCSTGNITGTYKVFGMKN